MPPGPQCSQSQPLLHHWCEVRTAKCNRVWCRTTVNCTVARSQERPKTSTNCRDVCLQAITSAAWLFANKNVASNRCIEIVWNHTLGIQKTLNSRRIHYNGIDQGRRSSGRCGVNKGVESNGNVQKKKIVTNYVCFCSPTMLTSKILTKFTENHSAFSGCSNNCNNFVSSRSW